ncbi:kinase-like domain-containing protein [Phialemonium atrogriseum]|uniref:Kinase-like domain-containing protein n=1 Tax=Phialemonium atrogriseum TaxID=1093897 RepID=A0AAJ0FN73_9PEZI|nr:kinase-like domain-containing protein [Phialemonium atrogriseum]KAK1768689.1 kinase-like domain-containing protein [Phialemonium atrogriseum]
MSSPKSTSAEEGTASSKTPPIVTSLQDLTIIEAWDSERNTSKYITFYVVTPDEEVYFGQSPKKKKDMTLAEYSAALQRVDDDEIYPVCPGDTDLTIAPDNINSPCVYIKRPGLNNYETLKESNLIPKALLDETVIMEQISKSPHPNIIKYHGCRVRRGRITAILLEKLDSTLKQYASTPDFQRLDKASFFEALKSAVDFLHSLGLAHNDINPDNIMVKDGTAVLIDFGSCQPFGKRLQSLGTAGWYEELFFTSEKKHDDYSLGKLQQWLQNPECVAVGALTS